jgi:hypothetical protein
MYYQIPYRFIQGHRYFSAEGRKTIGSTRKDSLLSSPFRTNFEAREKLKKGEKRNVWK